jgi:hypothetical protein
LVNQDSFVPILSRWLKPVYGKTPLDGVVCEIADVLVANPATTKSHGEDEGRAFRDVTTTRKNDLWQRGSNLEANAPSASTPIPPSFSQGIHCFADGVDWLNPRALSSNASALVQRDPQGTWKIAV